MQREIKFRGKSIIAFDNVKIGDWVIGYLNVISGITLINRIEVDSETVGQYTGLKDKNGVEIYEGDEVNCKIYGITGELSYETTNEVIFTGGEFGIKDGDSVINMSYNEVEVIGNIHDDKK